MKKFPTLLINRKTLQLAVVSGRGLWLVIGQQRFCCSGCVSQPWGPDAHAVTLCRGNHDLGHDCFYSMVSDVFVKAGNRSLTNYLLHGFFILPATPWPQES